MRRRLGSLRVLALLLAVPAGELLRAQPSHLTRYDLNAMPWSEVNPALRVKTVVGEIGTFALVEFTAGYRSKPHHHTYEQINIGLSGRFHIPVAGTPKGIAHRRGVLIPADVEHNNDVSAASENVLVIEFQPVRRLDMLPERATVSLPVGVAALPVPPGWPLELDFVPASSAWEAMANGVRTKESRGRTVSVGIWDIPATTSEGFELRRELPGAEQFVYVLEGAVQVGADTDRDAVRAGTLLVTAPDAPALATRVKGGNSALLLVFEATQEPAR